jgi:hypothetical protein
LPWLAPAARSSSPCFCKTSFSCQMFVALGFSFYSWTLRSRADGTGASWILAKWLLVAYNLIFATWELWLTMERLFGIARGEQSGLFAETIHKRCGRSCDHVRLLALGCSIMLVKNHRNCTINWMVLTEMSIARTAWWQRSNQVPQFVVRLREL